MTDTTQAAGLTDRITAYLSGGGLFNPKLANHDVVRDLLIECRTALAAQAVPAAILHTAQHLQTLLSPDTLSAAKDTAGALVAMLAASPAPAEAKPCEGANCGSTDGKSHSAECIAESAKSQGWAEAKEEPHGWVVMWPRPGGGHQPIFTLGPDKPDYGPKLGPLLKVYPVYLRPTTPQPQAAQPVGFMSPKQIPRIVDPEDESGAYIPMRRTPKGNFTLALYTAAPAAQPVGEAEQLNDLRLSLVTAIHSLASDFENEIGTLDAEAKRSAKASISHTRDIAARWNYNGPLRAAPALTEEQERDKQDAERYRKLKTDLAGAVPMVRVQIMKRGQYLLQTVTGLDEAVDALRSTQGGE